MTLLPNLRCALLFAAIVLLQTTVARSDEASPAANAAPAQTLKVGVVDIPPFAIHESDGTWSGLGISLWEQIADKLGARWQPIELQQADVASKLRDHEIDLAIGAVEITAAGERDHDFSEPFLTAGLGFAEVGRRRVSLSGAINLFRDPETLKLLAWLFGSVLVVGLLIAIAERIHNAERFDGSLRRGVSTGMWWAAAAMTTIGDGDAMPRSTVGRTIALVWMFVGVAAVASLTAMISASLTVDSMQVAVQHPTDLFRLRIGTTRGGPGAEYLDAHHVAHASFATFDEALAALASGKVEAVVGPIPALRYEINKQFQGVLRVSPIVLESVSYAIGLHTGNPMRESINRALLEQVESDSWADVESEYLGNQ